jgi:nitrate/nitrite transporter NarK
MAWWVISGLLIRVFAPTATGRFDPRPWLVLGLTLLIFLAGREFFRG